jgi:hypothetical protein
MMGKIITLSVNHFTATSTTQKRPIPGAIPGRKVSSFHQGLIPIHCHVGRHDRQPTMPTMPRRLFVRSGVQWNFRNQQALLASVEMNGRCSVKKGLE